MFDKSEYMKKYNKVYNQKNKQSKSTKSKEYREQNLEKIKEKDKRYYERVGKQKKYFKNYPLATEQDYEHYLETTHCECCGIMFTNSKDRRRCQDHDHITGKLREVICGNCNLIEGLIRDHDHFRAIGQYLSKHKHKQ